MTLSEIERVVGLAEQACFTALERPADGGARETLFITLMPIVDPAFLDHGEGRSAAIQGPVEQAHVLAEIVRVRIDVARRGKAGDSSAAMSIQHGALDLHHVLRDLYAHLTTGGSA